MAGMLVVYAVWFALYDVWIMPDGRLDGAVSRGVAWLAAHLASGVGVEAMSEGRAVLAPDLADVPGVQLDNGCNGLKVLTLYVGFVLAWPARFTTRLAFLGGGLLFVYFIVAARAALMLLLQVVHWSAAFHFMHGFGTTALYYVTVLVLWGAFMWVSRRPHGGKPGRAGGASKAEHEGMSRAPWLLGVLVALLVAAGYWTVGREARAWAAREVATPIVEAANARHQIYAIDGESTARAVLVRRWTPDGRPGSVRTYFPAPAGGVQFLLPAIILAFLYPKRGYWAYFGLGHLVIGILALACLAWGVTGSAVGLYLFHLCQRYVMQAYSVAAPLLLFATARRPVSTEEV
jgi:exosortase/archaeosortase family protein